MKIVALCVCSLLLSTTVDAVWAAKRASPPRAQKPLRDALLDIRVPKRAPMPAPAPSNHFADRSGQPWKL